MVFERFTCEIFMYEKTENVASRLEAFAIRLEAIASRLEPSLLDTKKKNEKVK